MKYSYNRFGSKGQRVGQAVHDIISKEQPNYTVEEILEGMNQKFIQEFELCLENGMKKYDGPFHIFVLQKKELAQWNVSNVVRNFFINRLTAPDAEDMMAAYPHFTKLLYLIDPIRCELTVEWCIPGYEECISILKNPSLYDKDLVGWIRKFFPTLGKAA